MTNTEKQSAVEFDEPTHTYRFDGRVVPSVTQVLKAAGMVDDRWFNDEARERGRTVALAIQLHNACNLDIRKVPDGCRGYVEGWLKFLDETLFIPRDVEKPFYNSTYGYAGTPDAEGHVPGATRRLIVEAKTGCDAPQYQIQTAAYDMGYPQLHDRWCVRLKEDGTYAIREHTNPRDRDVFMAALKIVHWQRENLK